ncbi:hypothetical protein [Roseivivax sp. CAU 1753]
MRYALSAALVATLCGSLVTPALAQSDDGECGLQAEIVMQVVTARQTGSDAGAALRTVAQDLTGPAEKYASVVPAIAEWVYSLPEEQLGTEVGESWRTQCQNM